MLVGAFEWDWFGAAEREPAFAIVGVTDEILRTAARSLARQPLRAYDAVQLASALAARAADPSLTLFACFDETLARAARAEGFELLS